MIHFVPLNDQQFVEDSQQHIRQILAKAREQQSLLGVLVPEYTYGRIGHLDQILVPARLD